jgi:hypothetical protein
MAADACVRIVTVEAASREAGWSDHWVELLAQKPACKP